MAAAYVLRRLRVRWWPVYILVGGALSWIGMAKAGIEPALALAPIVPFMPHSNTPDGFAEGHTHSHAGMSARHPRATEAGHEEHSVLEQFEHHLKLFVDIGLFFFAFANAGVAFTSIGWITMIVLASLIVGKAIGVTLFSWLASRIGFPLPPGMDVRHLVVTGVIAGPGAYGVAVCGRQGVPRGLAFPGTGQDGSRVERLRRGGCLLPGQNIARAPRRAAAAVSITVESRVTAELREQKTPSDATIRRV